MTLLKILIIITSTGAMPSGEPTGVWLEELATPYYAFRDAGFEVVLVTTEGGPVPIDPRSREDVSQTSRRFLEDPEAMARIADTPALREVNAADFDALFLPGGHGTMWDLPNNPELAAALSKALAEGRVVGAVCHGPAGLVGVKRADGRPVVEGRKLTAFTDEEERAVNLHDEVPFLLETRLRELGARFEEAPNFEPLAVRDGNLVTGQNPASSQRTAELVIEALK